MAVGTLLLVSGFLAFNGASIGAVYKDGQDHVVIVANSVINTIMSGSGSVFMVLIMCKTGLFGKTAWPFMLIVNAVLIGIVRLIILF